MATRGIFETQRFVTGEAVEIELPAASLPLRMVSGLIDLVVMVLGVLLIVWVAPVGILVQDEALAQAFVIVIMAMVMAIVPITLETVLHGRTVGKLIMGLRTVRDDTGPIGFRHAVIRALVGSVELWMTAGGVALIAAATNERAKRLGDFAAGTYVVVDRSRLHLPPAPTMPPELDQWARQADIGVLPDALAVACRQFLARAGTLVPDSRARTGHELCVAVLHYIAPAPPQWAGAEQILAAVLTERRRRDEQRLDRAQALRDRVLGRERTTQPE
ncbi:RDD family protein [Ornithinimicrobium sp. Y1694]|uniref:RDD family protein n=1 Tax=Ornithinimicrobium sp. Y1694 TaxID=3418590 RepID=UPI003CF0F62E